MLAKLHYANYMTSHHITSQEGYHERCHAPKLVPPRSRFLTEGRKLAISASWRFGQFMALLDTQIVAASLNRFRRGFRPAPTKSPGCRRAYLMAEIVMIPLAAFLSQAMSTRWLFTLLGRSLHPVELALRHRLEHRVHDGVPRHPEVLSAARWCPPFSRPVFALFTGKRRR
jgi:DHA2 family multidrug resistance protein